ncbi:IS200/IS605 family transposase [Rhodopirellula halodulae]|uniref:IS200/IS605 family transposase n=1 Tax=Rhodopirellula halodulae TaxID=2894198 RepID=UPI001E5FF9E4|nr:IS200/IS605 family transposase [Rhodopirellula sp. JC737]MCC9654949.1 IS200/IS605 family transposase [Rhodopirellula sp. JC737]
MPSTHANILLHAVFSTKNRFKLIRDDWQDELFAYIGGTLREHKANLVKAGGVEDHVHLLFQSHPSFAIADTLRLIKANSSKWINEQRKVPAKFQWQTGYGVFSVSQSVKAAVSRYIDRQREHHAKQSYESEFLQLLDLHCVQYRKEFVFDQELHG